MTTTMNTGAASLSDERERAAITACALMIKGICLTRPNAEWTGAIEDRIQFMLKQMQAGAAIAAGGAQEARYEVSAGSKWTAVTQAQYEAWSGEKRIATYTVLPREAATVPMTDDQIVSIWEGMPDGASGFRKSWGYMQFARALLAASNGEQEVES